MGGKETSRGIFYQALVAVLEALKEDNWTEISVELETNEDKVDIGLFNDDMLNKVIQVKSSINAFGLTKVKRWIEDIYEDVKNTELSSKECQICLIGSVNKDVSDLSNALKKYYTNKLDNSSQKVLENLNVEKYNNTKLSIEILSISLDHLMGIARDKLNYYLSQKGIQLSQEQLVLVTNAIATEKMILSSTGEKISREIFEKKLENWILELRDYKMRKIKKVSIRSFKRGTLKTHNEADSSICFVDMFEGRYLKKGLHWNKDIYSKLSEEIVNISNSDYKYELLINAHTSITFAIGRLFDSKSGIESYPVQSTAFSGEQKWNISQDLTTYESLITNWEENKYEEDIFDCALLINITRDIYKDVKEYLQDEDIKVKKIINCKLPKQSNNMISNGNHAKQLADEIIEILTNRERKERLAVLHVFISAPVGFVYYLGTQSRGIGSMIIYEYDFEQGNTGTYSPGISFPNKYDN